MFFPYQLWEAKPCVTFEGVNLWKKLICGNFGNYIFPTAVLPSFKTIFRRNNGDCFDLTAILEPPKSRNAAQLKLKN